jgi:uncharacterized membrane protein
LDLERKDRTFEEMANEAANLLSSWWVCVSQVGFIMFWPKGKKVIEY